MLMPGLGVNGAGGPCRVCRSRAPVSLSRLMLSTSRCSAGLADDEEKVLCSRAGIGWRERGWAGEDRRERTILVVPFVLEAVVPRCDPPARSRSLPLGHLNIVVVVHRGVDREAREANAVGPRAVDAVVDALVRGEPGSGVVVPDARVLNLQDQVGSINAIIRRVMMARGAHSVTRSRYRGLTS